MTNRWIPRQKTLEGWPPTPQPSPRESKQDPTCSQQYYSDFVFPPSRSRKTWPSITPSVSPNSSQPVLRHYPSTPPSKSHFPQPVDPTACPSLPTAVSTVCPVPHVWQRSVSPVRTVLFRPRWGGQDVPRGVLASRRGGGRALLCNLLRLRKGAGLQGQRRRGGAGEWWGSKISRLQGDLSWREDKDLDGLERGQWGVVLKGGTLWIEGLC